MAYMQNGIGDFYPERPDIVSQLQTMAADLGGRLAAPRLEWKYSWMKPVFGYKAAKSAQKLFPESKAFLLRKWDKAMHELERRKRADGRSRIA